MPEKTPLPIQPDVLTWARRTASVTLDAAGKAAGVAPERVEEWERGESTPTLPQLRKLAEKYKRPLAVMFLPTPPYDFQPLRDFRRVDPGTGLVGPMPARVAYEIRLAQERREIALDMLNETGAEARPFGLTAQLRADPEQVAALVREHLRVAPIDIATWARTGKVFEGWRAAIEASDVLVFVMGGPHGPLVRDVRGFAIPAATLPVVAVNGKDRTNGRAFTLVHEFAHLLLGEGAVENAVAPDPRMPPAVRMIERWCNAVAAAVLMPAAAVADVAGAKDQHSEWGDAELARAAERLGVSREAALLRFVTMGRASRRSYARRRPAFEAEYDELDTPLGKSLPIAPHKTMVGRYGRGFARLVLAGYRDRRITLNDAAAFLGVQAKHVAYIERQAFKTA